MKYFRLVTAACVCGISFLALAQIGKIINVDVAKETPGAEPASFLGIVGHWVVESGSRNVLVEDGRTWKQGELAAGLADKALTLFGTGHEAFLKTVRASPTYPYAVAKSVDDFQNGLIWVRFSVIEGAHDQSAGILFNLKPNGDYMAMEYNCLQGKKDESLRLTLWSVVKGEAKLLKSSTGVPNLGPGAWSHMQVTVEGTKLTGALASVPLLEHTLSEPVSGKVGVWSKTDTVVMFDDFKVVPK